MPFSQFVIFLSSNKFSEKNWLIFPTFLFKEDKDTGDTILPLEDEELICAYFIHVNDQPVEMWSYFHKTLLALK